MPHFDQKLLFNDRFVNVDWVLDRHLHRHLNNFLYFNRFVDVYRFVNVDGSLNVLRNLHVICNFLDNLYRDFLFHFNIFWHLHYFLDNPLRSWNRFRHFNYDLDRFFNHNFLDYLFRYSSL